MASEKILSAIRRLSCVPVACRTCPRAACPDEGGPVEVAEAGADVQGHEMLEQSGPFYAQPV
ncbi:MAG: hypothetical protein QF681_12860 [Vicinamibacterales bacterium]|jgi:hypothetical protein|nr:hypothetical protein [Vicinamibacterales bacterium]